MAAVAVVAAVFAGVSIGVGTDCGETERATFTIATCGTGALTEVFRERVCGTVECCVSMGMSVALDVDVTDGVSVDVGSDLDGTELVTAPLLPCGTVGAMLRSEFLRASLCLVVAREDPPVLPLSCLFSFVIAATTVSATTRPICSLMFAARTKSFTATMDTVAPNWRLRYHHHGPGIVMNDSGAIGMEWPGLHGIASRATQHPKKNKHSRAQRKEIMTYTSTLVDAIITTDLALS
jgi:hypothetical protein